MIWASDEHALCANADGRIVDNRGVVSAAGAPCEVNQPAELVEDAALRRVLAGNARLLDRG